MPAPKKAAAPRRAPQDHQKPKAERENEPFEWEHDGQTFTIPPASSVKAGVIRRSRKDPAGEVGQIFSVFEEILDEKTLSIIDDMDLEDLGEMFMAWQKHGGSSLGES